MNIDPSKNLGTYSTYYLPKKYHQEHVKYLGYNSINRNEYSELTEKERDLSFHFGNMFFRTDPDNFGCSTTGSTEASLLAVLNVKKKWEDREDWTSHDPTPPQLPNIVMNHNMHHCWDRVCKYLDVEARYYNSYSNLSGKEDPDTLDSELTRLVDSNTILIVCTDVYTVLGNTDDISFVDNYVQNNHLLYPNLRIHVDLAIGGFIKKINLSPFKNVTSVNLSNHKYGLSYPGCGWVLFRDKSELHESLFQTTHYLKGKFQDIGFSFTKSASHIASQHLMHIQDKCHSELMEEIMDDACILTEKLYKKGIPFITRASIPIVYFDHTIPEVADMISRLDKLNYSVPNSKFQLIESNVTISRMVIKYNKFGAVEALANSL